MAADMENGPPPRSEPDDTPVEEAEPGQDIAGPDPSFPGTTGPRGNTRDGAALVLVAATLLVTGAVAAAPRVKRWFGEKVAPRAKRMRPGPRGSQPDQDPPADSPPDTTDPQDTTDR